VVYRESSVRVVLSDNIIDTVVIKMVISCCHCFVAQETLTVIFHGFACCTSFRLCVGKSCFVYCCFCDGVIVRYYNV